MREIVEVGLKNFQSHKDTVINFESGFNVIVGASDSGKTAIKRGIESVLYNKYVGAEYIREGEKSFSNYVLFNDGLRITREKGGRGLNRYLIEYPDGQSLELNNFGVKVPQEVLNAHGMHLVELGKEIDSLNCAYQLSGPFFLQNTAGERASIISSIAKTKVIDEAVLDTMSKHRESKKELKSLESENKSLEKEISTYAVWIDEAKLLMDKLEEDYLVLENLSNKHSRVDKIFSSVANNEVNAAIQRNIIEKYEDIHIEESKVLDLISEFSKVVSLENKYNRMESDIKRKAGLENISTGYEGVELIEKYITEIITIKNRYNSISKKIELIEEYKTKKEELEVVINAYSNVDKMTADIDSLIDNLTKYNALSKKKEALDALLTRKSKGEAIIQSLDKSLNEALNKYQKALEVLGKCPVCYSVITEEQFSNIKENLA